MVSCWNCNCTKKVKIYNGRDLCEECAPYFGEQVKEDNSAGINYWMGSCEY